MISFVSSHCARLLRQPSTFVVGVILIALCIAGFYGRGAGDCSQHEAPGAYGTFVCYAPFRFVFLLPILAALVGGITASSRARGDDVVYATRDLKGTRLALARVFAGSTAAALCTLVCGVLIIVAALLLLPHQAELERPHGMVVIPGYEKEEGIPLPALWRASPLANDFLAVGVYALAAAALAAVGNAVGQLVLQPMFALAAPVFLVLFSQIFPTPEKIDWLAPYSLLALLPTGGPVLEYVAGTWRLVLLLGYWGGIFAVSCAVVIMAARRQEARK